MRLCRYQCAIQLYTARSERRIHRNQFAETSVVSVPFDNLSHISHEEMLWIDKTPYKQINGAE